MVDSFLLTPYTLLFLLAIYYFLPYIHFRSLRSIPGPPLAAFSNLWLLYQCRRARRFQAVDQAHKRYGTLVRIQPDHVSVADESAINAIYGHGNGFLKDQFYDAFVGLGNVRGLFNTRNRAEHTRKRKIVSNTFSAASIKQFEPYIANNVEVFIDQWDRIAEIASIEPGKYAQMNALHWFNYLAFDVIGDLAFGAPFGMLEKGADIAEVRSSPGAPAKYAPAVQVLNRRGEVSATVGCMPWIKPYAAYLPDPFFYQGMQAIKDLAGIAIARVKGRLESADDVQSSRKDLLARLMEGKDEHGAPLGRTELTVEALTQLIAGSDTTSNTMCALLYHACSTPHVVPKLQAELDAVIPWSAATTTTRARVPKYEDVRDLPYLDSVIKETLRIHSTSSLGLPRLIPEGSPGVTICGTHFPSGTVLSVPSYTIHHSTSIWGDDADEYRPERWNKDVLTERQRKAFIPFSHGPRACVGQNVAVMELAVFVACIFRWWEFEVRQQDLETREGFLRKPVGLNVGIRHRHAPEGVTPLR